MEGLILGYPARDNQGGLRGHGSIGFGKLRIVTIGALRLKAQWTDRGARRSLENVPAGLKAKFPAELR